MAVLTKNRRKGPTASVRCCGLQCNPSKAASPAHTAQAVLQGWEPLLWALGWHWVSAQGRITAPVPGTHRGACRDLFLPGLAAAHTTLPACLFMPLKASGSGVSASKTSMVGRQEGAYIHNYFLNLLSIRERPGH